MLCPWSMIHDQTEQIYSTACAFSTFAAMDVIFCSNSRNIFPGFSLICDSRANHIFIWPNKARFTWIHGPKASLSTKATFLPKLQSHPFRVCYVKTTKAKHELKVGTTARSWTSTFMNSCFPLNNSIRSNLYACLGVSCLLQVTSFKTRPFACALASCETAGLGIGGPCAWQWAGLVIGPWF